MKGRTWYQAPDVARSYEGKRFSGGGRLIDERERTAVRTALAPLADREVLEVACGTGRFSVMCARDGARVTGLDISAAMLAEGRAKARRAGVDIEWVRGEAARLPFPDDAFDAVLAMRFFHLADDPARFLHELARVSRDRIVFDTFNAASARSVYNWLLPMGSRLYEETEVRALVADVGLGIDRVEHDFVVPYGFYRQIPDDLAMPVRRVETSLTGRLRERLASVSFWTVGVD